MRTKSPQNIFADRAHSLAASQIKAAKSRMLKATSSWDSFVRKIWDVFGVPFLSFLDEREAWKDEPSNGTKRFESTSKGCDIETARRFRLQKRRDDCDRSCSDHPHTPLLVFTS
jgi:hypothetical protein